MSGRRGWSFRVRLTALIAGVFILGGTVLLGVQYLLVQQLYTAGIDTILSECDEVSWVTDPEAEEVVPTVCVTAHDPTRLSETGDDPGTISIVVAQTTLLSEQVLAGLLAWSVGVLAVFSAAAVAAAWWLSKRSLGRIARITATAQQISHHNRRDRLALTGPRDEVKELGDTIDGMLDRLDDALTRQERFIAGASHELRTPLTTTRTALEIPLAQGRVPDDLRPAVERALAANERSERIIAALLRLARASVGERGERERVDLSELAAASVSALESVAAERGVRVLAPPQAEQLVEVDRDLLRVAIDNLTENAVRHNRTGGLVTVRVERTQEDALLVVENDGERLAASEVERLIEPFNRGSASRTAGEGTGLGLTLADAIARSQEGSLLLGARPAGGLVTTLSLPAATPGAPVSAARAADAEWSDAP